MFTLPPFNTGHLRVNCQLRAEGLVRQYNLAVASLQLPGM